MATNTNTKATLCWDCANYAYGCSWSEELKPVKGWDAIPTKNQYFSSYIVLACPKFDRDAQKNGMLRLGETDRERQKRERMLTRPPSPKQRMIIDLIYNESVEPVPLFEGENQKDAEDYIRKYERFIVKEDQKEWEWFARK